MSSLPFICKSGVNRKSSESSAVWVWSAEGWVSVWAVRKRERSNPAKVLLSSSRCVCVCEQSGERQRWSSLREKWGALGTASRISDAEKNQLLKARCWKKGGRADHREVSHRVARLNKIQNDEMQLLVNLECKTFCPVWVTAPCKPERPPSTSSHSGLDSRPEWSALLLNATETTVQNIYQRNGWDSFHRLFWTVFRNTNNRHTIN